MSTDRVDPLSDLAEIVWSRLDDSQKTLLASATIRKMLHVVYWTTLKSEEKERLRCTVAYVDPKNIDPDPPTRPAFDHWSCIPFAAQLPFDVRSLTKIAQAADPVSTFIAVYCDSKGELFIWGLIDQVALHTMRMVTWETDHGPSTPGFFYVTANGAADITVARDYSILGALKQDSILQKYDNVFDDGHAIHSILCQIVKKNIKSFSIGIDGIPQSNVIEWVTSEVVSTISRILFNIQAYRHGGALLFARERSKANLNVKYGITYSRMTQAISRRITQEACHSAVAKHIFEHALPKRKEIREQDFQDYARTDVLVRESLAELAGYVRFVASLSRVDGLILMGDALEVLGFGVEIVGVPEVESVFVARDPHGKAGEMVAANHFGTRHRSMMRYCDFHGGSVGFVVSQDGFVRAIATVRGRLTMWDNVQVEYHTDPDEDVTDGCCPNCEAHGVNNADRLPVARSGA